MNLWRRRTKNVVDLIEVAGAGISMLVGAPALVEALNKLDHAPVEDLTRARHHEQREARAHEQAALAKREVEADFPLLHALGCAWLWTSLETLVEDVMVAVLANDPLAADADTIRDLRIPMSAAATGDKEHLALAAYQELELKRGSAFRSGVTRFEGLLGAVGLKGPIPTQVRNRVFELGQVRNVVLHRGGIADRAFVEACPSFGQETGKPLAITHDVFTLYVFATMHYAAIVESRLGIKYPREPAATTTPLDS